MRPVFLPFVRTLAMKRLLYGFAAWGLLPNLRGQEDDCLAFDLYILAMSHHRLGEAATTRTYYDLAARSATVHASRLADGGVLVGLVGISGRPDGGYALGSAVFSSDPRPVNAVTPAPQAWAITADPASSALPAVPVSPALAHMAKDQLF